MPRSAKKRRTYKVDQEERKMLQKRYADIVEKFNIGEFGPYTHVGMEEFFRILF